MKNMYVPGFCGIIWENLNQFFIALIETYFTSIKYAACCWLSQRSYLRKVVNRFLRLAVPQKAFAIAFFSFFCCCVCV